MTDTCEQNLLPKALTYEDVRAVSPALERHTKFDLLDLQKAAKKRSLLASEVCNEGP